MVSSEREHDVAPPNIELIDEIIADGDDQPPRGLLVVSQYPQVFGEQHQENSEGPSSDQGKQTAQSVTATCPSPELVPNTDGRPSSVAEEGEGEGEEEEEEEEEEPAATGTVIPASLTLRLYTSHFLSTWNSRVFEFGAVLFLASIYPGTLMPLSVYALTRSAAAILFAQPVGSWIDRGNRLAIVRLSIVLQRVAVAASCGLFWVLDREESGTAGLGTRVKDGLFAATVALACVEKVSSVMNLVSVERDWVVVITDGNEGARRALNARMRRIDLLCKLLGPLTISLIAIASILVAIWATLAMNILSVLFEYVCIGGVYQMVPTLRRTSLSTAGGDIESNSGRTTREPSPHPHSGALFSRLKAATYHILPISSLPFYLHHPAFLPSFSLTLLYFTVLSFSGQMITYLISVGYTPLYVGVARTVSTVFELSATWIAPRLARRIGVVRGGIWSISWQMLWLAAGVCWFFAGHDRGSDSVVVSATGLAVGVALSRVGLWSFDLCAQNIVQDEVDADHRGTFSSVEAAFQNLFELLSYAATIIFSRPDQFKWPVVISTAAVYLAGGLYTSFVRKRRGHLFHTPPCVRIKPENDD